MTTAGQLLHVPWPVRSWYVPAAQIEHTALDVAPCVDHPAGQVAHLVWPAASWNAPAAQGSHAATRSPVSYVPAAHAAHALWPVAGWRHPAGQLAHAAALERPVCALNVPAAHAVHDVALEQPPPLCRPAGQSAQALQALIVVGPLRPPMQGQPAWRPTWYWPAPHPPYP